MMPFHRVVHAGVAWTYRLETSNSWYYAIKAFPLAVKPVIVDGKETFVPDLDHPSIAKYESER